MSRSNVKVVAQLETATTTRTVAPLPADALQLELKKRIAAKNELKPAGSIREALARWLDEEM